MIMTIKVLVRLLDKTTGTTKGYYLMDNLGAMWWSLPPKN